MPGASEYVSGFFYPITDFVHIMCGKEEQPMKLRTKLVIVFLTVMILPVIFMTIAVYAIGPGEAGEVLQLYMLLVFITTALLIYWIYRSVSVPLSRLQKAARNIKEGNLDFEIRQESDDEIGQLCQDFEEMRMRLKIQAEERVRFDRENKELISNMEGIMDGVADTPEKMDRYIRTIYNKTSEMDLLINELTFYSKIDTNRIPYNFATISARDYFEDCAEDLRMELDGKGVAFSYRNTMPEDCKVIVDPEQLRRVINNIVSNSLKYMDKEQGKVTMEIKDVGDFIQVELGDNGKGIAAKDLPYIFDRFYRTDASRNSSKGGSGIGLSIVKKIVEEHGGNIWATSDEGAGTTMYFVIRKYQEVPIDE